MKKLILLGTLFLMFIGISNSCFGYKIIVKKGTLKSTNIGKLLVKVVNVDKNTNLTTGDTADYATIATRVKASPANFTYVNKDFVYDNSLDLTDNDFVYDNSPEKIKILVGWYFGSRNTRKIGRVNRALYKTYTITEDTTFTINEAPNSKANSSSTKKFEIIKTP